MSRLTYSKLALADLEGILNYIAADRPTAATAFVDRIIATCRLVAQFPEIGQPREDLHKGLRLFTVRRYGIYYRIANDGVAIERVLHGAMDVGPSSFLGNQ